MDTVTTLLFRSLFFFFLLPFLSDARLTAQWNSLPDFPAQTDASFSFVIGETAYVSGGLTSAGLFTWSDATRMWTNAGNLPAGQARPWAFAFAYNGKGYMGGGAVNGTTVTNEFDEYDPVTGQWIRKAPFGGGARDGCFAFVLGDKAYVGAGFDGAFIHNDVWEYNFDADIWSRVADFPGGGVLFSSSFVLNGKGYVVGGGGQTESSALFEFDPATKEWTRKADFPGAARQAAVCFALDGLGYYGGGMSGYTQTFQDFWTYNPVPDRWTKLTDRYPEQFSAWSVAFALGEKGYVGTGATFVDQGIVLSNNFYSYPYDPPTPTAQLSSTAIDFGQVGVGTSSDIDLTLTAAGAAELQVQSVEFGSADAAGKGLAFSTNPALPSALPGLATMTITVSFTPVAVGDVGTVLLIRTNDPANPELSVTVSGTGREVLHPAAQFSAAELDFGEVRANEEKSLLLNISPLNEAGLEVGSISITNPSSSPHGFSFTSGRTLPVALSLGETLDVTVRFNPADTGNVTAELTVLTNISGAPVTTIGLSGHGFDDDVTSVNGASSTGFIRAQAMPNPVTDAADLLIRLTERSVVAVHVVDMQGRKVVMIPAMTMSAGLHTRTIDFSMLPSGNYFVEILAGEGSQRIKLMKLP